MTRKQLAAVAAYWAARTPFEAAMARARLVAAGLSDPCAAFAAAEASEAAEAVQAEPA